MIKSTSFSRLKIFRECPLKAKLMFVDRIPDPRPIKEDQEHPLERGSRIHELAENAVRDGWEEGQLPKDLQKFEPRLAMIRELYLAGKAQLELPIAMDDNWRQSDPKDFDNTVYRMIADVFIEPDDNTCIVIDYKTGRKDGNEVTHTQQGMDYLAATYILRPEIQMFAFEAWYLDKGDILPTVSFTRAEMVSVAQDFMKAHEEMRRTRMFPPTPSHNGCLYCPFKKGTVGRGKNAYAGTGHCDKNPN